MHVIFAGDSCQYWLDLENKKLTSPFYPKPYVSDGLGCEWLITAPEDNYIVLEFTDFFFSLSQFSGGRVQAFFFGLIITVCFH